MTLKDCVSWRIFLFSGTKVKFKCHELTVVGDDLGRLGVSMSVMFLRQSETATNRNGPNSGGGRGAAKNRAAVMGLGVAGAAAEPTCHTEFSCHSSQPAVSQRQFYTALLVVRRYSWRMRIDRRNFRLAQCIMHIKISAVRDA